MTDCVKCCHQIWNDNSFLLIKQQILT